ncbi:MAG: type I 3-dehydroquinate dehydratase [bacterium]
MQQIRICTVVTGSTLREFLINLKYATESSDLVELRVDYLENLTKADLKIIKQQLDTKAILTCRHQSQGGKFNGSPKLQNEMLQEANDLGFEFLDIDLQIAAKILIKNKKSQLIISYHNFLETPSTVELQEILEQMSELRADVKKLAVQINSHLDLQNVYRILLNKAKTEKIIVIGMGEMGKISRITAPLLGSYLTFGSLNAGLASAPGQMTSGELENVFKMIRKTVFGE